MAREYKIHHPRAKSCRERLIQYLLEYIIQMTPSDMHLGSGPYILKGARRVYCNPLEKQPDTGYTMYKGSTMKGRAIVWNMYEPVFQVRLNWFLDYHILVTVKNINYLVFEYTPIRADENNPARRTQTVQGTVEQVKELNNKIAELYGKAYGVYECK